MLAALLAVCSLFAPPPQDAADAPPSRIVDVVVFPNHAEVTREIVVDASRGTNRVDFTSLVPILNPNSLRASLLGAGRVTGTELRTVHLTSSLSEEIAALDAQIRASEDELALWKASLTRAGEEGAFYRSVKDRLSGDLSRELADGDVSVDEWKSVLGFVRDGLASVDAETSDVGLEIRAVEERLATLRAEREDYAGRTPPEMKEVTVQFVAEQSGEIAVRIHYIVDAVHWTPSYDVQLDREAREVTITGYGQVMQWTGETWDDVSLVLAMSRPDAELSMPALAPMVASLDQNALKQVAKDVAFLNSSARGAAQKWSEKRFARVQDRETFRRNLEQLARQTQEALNQFGLSRESLQGALDRLVDRFAGVRYEVEGRETIPHDTSSHKVVTFTATVPVELKFVATPALGDTVMLLGDVTNTTGHPVLEGSVSLFVDGSYVGVSQVHGAAQNERVLLGFGPDDALVVRRRLVSRTTKGPEAFRQSQVISYTYEIELENFDVAPVEVEVADQIPVSTTDAIQVSYLGSTVEGGHEEATGVLRWPLEVAAGERVTIRYGFSVECPVDAQVSWK